MAKKPRLEIVPPKEIPVQWCKYCLHTARGVHSIVATGWTRDGNIITFYDVAEPIFIVNDWTQMERIGVVDDHQPRAIKAPAGDIA